eukprot:403360151
MNNNQTPRNTNNKSSLKNPSKFNIQNYNLNNDITSINSNIRGSIQNDNEDQFSMNMGHISTEVNRFQNNGTNQQLDLSKRTSTSMVDSRRTVKFKDSLEPKTQKNKKSSKQVTGNNRNNKNQSTHEETFGMKAAQANVKQKVVRNKNESGEVSQYGTPENEYHYNKIARAGIYDQKVAQIYNKYEDQIQQNKMKIQEKYYEAGIKSFSNPLTPIYKNSKNNFQSEFDSENLENDFNQTKSKFQSGTMNREQEIKSRLSNRSRVRKQQQSRDENQSSLNVVSTLNVNAHQLDYFDSKPVSLPTIKSGGNTSKNEKKLDIDDTEKQFEETTKNMSLHEKRLSMAQEIFRGKSKKTFQNDHEELNDQWGSDSQNKVNQKELHADLKRFEEEHQKKIIDLSDDDIFDLGQKMDIHPQLFDKKQGQLMVRSQFGNELKNQPLPQMDPSDIDENFLGIKKQQTFIDRQAAKQQIDPNDVWKLSDQVSYDQVLKTRAKAGEGREGGQQKELSKLKNKLQTYAHNIDEDLEKNFKSTSEKINFLKNLGKTPLQRYFNELKDKKYLLTPDILEFDKKFFQNQLDKVSKAYQVEIRNQQIMAREKAIEYVELNLTRAKQQLQTEMRGMILQVEELQIENEKMREQMYGQFNQIVEQEVHISGLRAFAECDAEELERAHAHLQENDQTLLQIRQDNMHQKLMGFKVDFLKEIKKDKLLNQTFNLYGYQIRLTFEEKLNLFERELVQIYKRKYGQMKDQMSLMQHETDSARIFIEMMKEREKNLEDNIKELKFKVSSLESQLFKDHQIHNQQMNEISDKNQTEKDFMQKEYQDYQNMTVLEIKILEGTIEKYKDENDKLQNINKDLLTRLKIPRLHYKYLEEHGTLDEFVQTKKEDLDAKQVLLKTLEIQRRNDKKKINMSNLRTSLNASDIFDSKTSGKFVTTMRVASSIDREQLSSKLTENEKFRRRANQINKTSHNFYSKQPSPLSKDLIKEPFSLAEKSILNMIHLARKTFIQQQ